MLEAHIDLGMVDDRADLIERLFEGETFVDRQTLVLSGLYSRLAAATLTGIRNAMGVDVADKVEASGFDRVHEFVRPEDIPRMTDAVSDQIVAGAHGFIKQLIPWLFPGRAAYYYERTPNVRFHIPFGLAASQKKLYSEFTKRRGEGKITVHGPHRDSWVDCPANAINLWVAIGPVQRGNGLSIYAKDYRAPLRFKRGGYIEENQNIHQPINVEMAPGDILIFHGDHLHASELNRTDATRAVVSYRIVFGRPKYPNGHYHHYVHAGMADGPLRKFAGVPADLQIGYVTTRMKWAFEKLGLLRDRETSRFTASPQADGIGEGIPVEDLPIHSIRAVSRGVCIARLSEDEFVAFKRRCPHEGGDMADGWLVDGKVICPLHNLPFDAKTGKSDCAALVDLRYYPCRVVDGRVLVEQ